MTEIERIKKYPIDIDAFIQEFKQAHPSNTSGVAIFSAILPMVNDAYQQGYRTARAEQRKAVKA